MIKCLTNDNLFRCKFFIRKSLQLRRSLEIEKFCLNSYLIKMLQICWWGAKSVKKDSNKCLCRHTLIWLWRPFASKGKYYVYEMLSKCRKAMTITRLMKSYINCIVNFIETLQKYIDYICVVLILVFFCVLRGLIANIGFAIENFSNSACS